MATSGTMKVNVVGDASKFNRAMDNAQGKLGKLGGAAKKFGALAGKSIAAVGVAAVAGAFKVASFGDEVAKSAGKAGLGVEQFQELRFAFGQGGVEAGTFDTAMQKFNKRLGESATMGGTADEAFDRLGVSLKDADGNVREAGGAMDEVLPKLAQIESDSERAAVAGDLFGQTAGPELSAALSEGVGGIEDARQKAQDLGIVMDEEATAKAEKFSDSFDDIKQSTLGLLRTGLTPLMSWMADEAFPFIKNKIIPALADFRDWIGPKISVAAGIAQTAITTIVQAAKGLFDLFVRGDFTSAFADAFNVAEDSDIVPFLLNLRDKAIEVANRAVTAFRKISDWWSDNGPMIVSTAQTIGGTIVDFARTAGRWISTFAEVVDTAISTVIGWFESSGSQASETSTRMQSVFSQLLSTTQTVWNAISTVIGATIEAVSAVVSATVAVIQTVWERWGDDIKQFAETVFNAILNIIDGVLQAISGVFDVFAGLFTGDWERVWEGVKDIFAGLLNIMQGLWEMALGAVELALQVFRDVMSSIWSRLWTWAKDFVSDRVDDVVGFVKGLPGRAREGLSSAWSAYQEFWEEKFQAVADFVSDRVDDVIGFFRDLPGNIVDELGDLGSTLFDAGKDLLEGLGEGVKSAVGSLGSALSDAVSSAAEHIPFVDATGDGPGGFTGPGSGGGPAAARAAQAAAGLPLTQTSGYRTPAQNRAAGGSPTSWHLDKSNPATDWAGPTWALDKFAARLRQMGGWRELLWRVPNHAPGDNPHVHVAHEGGMVTPRGIEPLRADEVVAKLRAGETVRTREQESELQRRGGTTINQTFVTQGNVRADAQAAKLALMR